MKNTRKKMLLSSVAMLLVALVALGSATFAWYITNATVTAKESQFSASTADGLVIRHKDEGEWLSELTDLEKKTNLTPASISYDNPSTVVGATGSGTSFEDGTLKDGTLSKVDVQLGSYFLVDSFYVASSTTENKNVEFKIVGTTVENTYMNLAVYVGNELKVVLTSDPETSWTQTQKVETSGASVKTADAKQDLVKMGSSGGSYTIPGTFVATPKSGSGTKITVIGFADGYNPRCTSKLANTSDVKCTYEFSVAGE